MRVKALTVESKGSDMFALVGILAFVFTPTAFVWLMNLVSVR